MNTNTTILIVVGIILAYFILRFLFRNKQPIINPPTLMESQAGFLFGD